MDIRYIAGLIDADGHITIRKVNSKVFVVVCGFTNCYKPVVDEFARIFGGSVHYMNQAVRKPSHRPTWGWVAGNQVANRFLKEVIPHLVIKKKDAELALSLQESIDAYKTIRTGRRGGSYVPDSVTAMRQLWHDECKSTKKICFYPDTPKSPMSQ